MYSIQLLPWVGFLIPILSSTFVHLRISYIQVSSTFVYGLFYTDPVTVLTDPVTKFTERVTDFYWQMSIQMTIFTSQKSMYLACTSLQMSIKLQMSG